MFWVTERHVQVTLHWISPEQILLFTLPFENDSCHLERVKSKGKVTTIQFLNWRGETSQAWMQSAVILLGALALNLASGLLRTSEDYEVLHNT